VGNLGFPVEAAMLEVPFNIAQVIFGTFIAVPLVTYLADLGIISRFRTENQKNVQDSLT
jgi:hypothetical protein